MLGSAEVASAELTADVVSVNVATHFKCSQIIAQLEKNMIFRHAKFNNIFGPLIFFKK
jgi:hypothetical protein